MSLGGRSGKGQPTLLGHQAPALQRQESFAQTPCSGGFGFHHRAGKAAILTQISIRFVMLLPQGPFSAGAKSCRVSDALPQPAAPLGFFQWTNQQISLQVCKKTPGTVGLSWGKVGKRGEQHLSSNITGKAREKLQETAGMRRAGDAEWGGLAAGWFGVFLLNIFHRQRADVDALSFSPCAGRGTGITALIWEHPDPAGRTHCRSAAHPCSPHTSLLTCTLQNPQEQHPGHLRGCLFCSGG